MRVRTYRNRRIGDFLKELHLTEETHQLRLKTHQLKEETHQLEPKTHQLEEIIKKENLPLELKLKLDNLKKRPKKADFKSMIYALYAWHPLTAQQIAELLDRKLLPYRVFRQTVVRYILNCNLLMLNCLMYVAIAAECVSSRFPKQPSKQS